MAFDWTTVEGYRDDMSAEEKLALLENYAPPAPATDEKPASDPEPAPAPIPAPAPAPKNVPAKPGYVPKRDFDKLSSDFAEVKRQLRALRSDEVNREEDRKAELAARDAELEALRREKMLSNYTASFLGRGYAEDMAKEAATAFADNDADALFDVMQRRDTAYEKALRAKILAETPKPPASTDPNGEEAKKKSDALLRGYFGL